MSSRLPPDLHSPLQAGAFRLAHRVVMPAATLRMARPVGVPTAQMADHYAERASAGGLVICEAAAVSPAVARPDCPGLYNAEQVNHWRLVTDAVRGAGGIVIAQLSLDCHLTRDPGAPRPVLDLDGLERMLLDYRSAAENASDAGFDGVELQAAHGALPEQLLQGDAPALAEGYHGGADERMRFLNEVLQSLIGVWGRDRVGVCLSPLRPDGGRMFGQLDAMAFYGSLLGNLYRQGIAYLSLVEPGFSGTAPPPSRQMLPRVSSMLRPFFPGVLLAAGGFDLASARKEIQSGRADAVAFGRAFLSEPDFALRWSAEPVPAR